MDVNSRTASRWFFLLKDDGILREHSKGGLVDVSEKEHRDSDPERKKNMRYRASRYKTDSTYD